MGFITMLVGAAEDGVMSGALHQTRGANGLRDTELIGMTKVIDRNGRFCGILSVRLTVELLPSDSPNLSRVASPLLIG